MTWAIEHPERHRRFGRRMETLPGGGVRAWALPMGAGGVGLSTLVVAAWGGISVFVGPLFGYRPTTVDAWHWAMQNWLLHLVPGAVGVFAGLVMLATVGTNGPWRRSGLGLASLLTIASGAWFVVGPVAYRWFESSAAFLQGASPRNDFVNQMGSSLGPGVLLAVLGGMALKAGIANPRVVLEREGPPVVAPMEPEDSSSGEASNPTSVAPAVAPHTAAHDPAGRPARGAQATDS